MEKVRSGLAKYTKGRHLDPKQSTLLVELAGSVQQQESTWTVNMMHLHFTVDLLKNLVGAGVNTSRYGWHSSQDG